MTDPFSPAELLHYGRQINLPQVGMAGQMRLKQARVLCIGAGGLGSSALYYLAAAGVGTLGIIDDDLVEASNLQRQILYSYDDIGQKKVAAAKSRLAKLNPAIQIVTHGTRLSELNCVDVINDYDIVIDGSDNYATRYVVNDTCLQLNKPHVYASISQFTGQCTLLTTNEGPCYRCLFDAPPQDAIPTCAQGGVLGVLPGMMGCIQASEAMKWILDVGKPLVNRLLTFDALDMSFREYQISRNPDCRQCAGNVIGHQEKNMFTKPHQDISVTQLHALINSNADFFLLDVREPQEYAAGHLDGRLIPLKTLPDQLNSLDKSKHIVVYCKSGGRSHYAAELLRANGFANVSNLLGGFTAWKEKFL